MSISFVSGSVIKVIENYFSETDVYSSPSLFSGGSYISTSSVDICKTDVWIRCNGKDVCISIDMPFKALAGHVVTVSYDDHNQKKPIQLINDSTEFSVWCSKEMKYKHDRPSTSYARDYLDNKNSRVLKKANEDFLPISLSLIFFLVMSFLNYVWITGGIAVIFLISTIGYQWYKSATNYKQNPLYSSVFFLPLFVMAFFINGSVDVLVYSLFTYGLVFLSKYLEVDMGSGSHIAPEIEPVGYLRLKRDYYSEKVD